MVGIVDVVVVVVMIVGARGLLGEGNPGTYNFFPIAIDFNWRIKAMC